MFSCLQNNWLKYCNICVPHVHPVCPTNYNMSSHTTAPTLQLLAQELHHVARWQTLGIFLSMMEDEITVIEQDHPAGDTARRRTAMLDKWLKKQEKPSWMSIIGALEKMSEMSLANKLRSKYMSPSQQPTADVCLAETQPTSSNVLEVHRSDAIVEKIEKLRVMYFKLVTKTESDLEKANLSSKVIKRFSQIYVGDEVECVTIEELIDQLKPFFFLDYALLEKIIMVLLEQNQPVVNKLDDYIQQLDQFKKSTTIQQFIKNIETAQNASPQRCTVTIQLVGSWLPKTISDLEKLLKEIFRNKAAVLTHLKIVRNCVLVTYLVQRSKAISLIEAAQAKISFMMKVGVSVLQVGDTVVTSTQSKTSDISFESSLIRSVKDNNINVLSFLLDISTSPDATDDKGLTGLLWASYLGRTEAANLLLKANANPNLHREDGVTPLFMASQKGHSDIVSFLLNDNADCNLCRENGVTPLFMASQNGHSDIIHLLLKANANPNLHRIDGVTPLFMASENGHSDIVCFLLKAKADPNFRRDDGVTPLFMASQNGHSGIIHLLLEANANPNLRRMDGVTPLLMASWNGYSDIVNFLINAKADPNHCRDDGVTPLFLASQCGHSDIVAFLLKADANPNLCRDDGATPLMVASQYGHLDVVVSLLKTNANPNHQTDEGMTPLMAACFNRHPRIVHLFLTNGADPGLQDSNNSTACTFAHRSGCLKSKQLLSMFGTDSFPQTYDLDTIVSDVHGNSKISQESDLDIDKGTKFR